MDDHDFDELEDPATWDDDEGIVHPPVQNPRATVSVRLTLPELERIEHEATVRGLRLTDFMRQASLNSVGAVPSEKPPVRRLA